MKTGEKLITSDLATHLESIEVAAWGDFHVAASGKTASACGIGANFAGPACGAIASEIDTLAFNRIIGLGMGDKATEKQLDKLIAPYRKQGAKRFFVQLCPAAIPDTIPSWLEERDFQYYNNWVKLYRGVDPCPPVETDLQVRLIGVEQAASFARIIISSFEWSEQLEPWVARTVGRPGWRHYMAFDGEIPAATAAIYIEGENGWIDFASTLPEYRGRGAQGTLVERRIKDAAALGCKRLVVETAEETPEHPSPSYRNMRRYGFEAAYLRPNYIMTLE
jgi:GNAT superfamily N-acetyltransferase